MKKNLLAFLLCIVGLHGAYATDFSASYVSETDTAEHITLIQYLKVDPYNPTENDEIFLRSHLMTNSSYKQQIRFIRDTILINGSFSILANSEMKYTVITDSLGKLPAGRYFVEHHVEMLGDMNEVVQEMTKNLQFSVEKFGVQVVDTNLLDTGTVVTPVIPSKPTVYVPTIHEGDNVTEYPHNPAVDEMLSSVKPAQQEFTMTIEGDYLRIKGLLFARGYDKHYIHCQIIGDSVHLQRFDMDPESTDMLPHYVDIRIPGFTEDYYHVTLAEQNDVPLYKQYMVMSRRVKREAIQKNSEFSITGTKWYSNINYGNFLSGEYGNTTICYSIGEDTIYNGEIWKSFHVDGEYYGAIREQDGQLWIYPSKENQFGLRRNVPTLLYDFTLQVGDVIYTHDFYPGYIKEFSPEEFDEYSLYPITVKDVFEMNGRKVINLEHGIQWIEGIGDIDSPFLSGWRPVASDGSYANEQLYQVVCNGQTIYFNGEFANSQSTPWMKEGMTWTQNWGYSDTSDGQFRQIMLKEEVRPGTFNFDWTESWYNTPYKKLQEFNGKVYAYDDYYHRFDLCYDFTLQEGDKVNLLASYNFEDPTRFSFPILSYDTCIVAKVDSVEIDGTMRKRLTLTGDREDVWVEGIGSLSRVFPIDGFDNIAYSVVYNPSRITCLSNNEESIYLHPNFVDCTTVNNVPSFTKENTHILINASSLLCTSPNATKLEVYTMDAVKVGEANFANGEAKVKVDKTPATYLYIVTYPNGSRESGKVMVK